MIVLLVFVLCVAAELPEHGPGADWVEQQIYTSFVSNPCVTVSDRSGALGCRTDMDGVTGVLVSVSSEAELEAALAAASSFDPVAVLLDPSLLKNDVVLKLQSAVHVVGVAIADYNSSARPAAFSPAPAYPNKAYGLHPDSTHVWNPYANSMSFVNLQKPWFSLGRGDTESISKSLRDALRSGTRLGAQFILQMHSDSDSETCLRRGYCDAIGGVSVMASLSSKGEVANASQVVGVFASLDSSSLFHTRAPGGVSDVSGAVALLAAFRALKESFSDAVPKIPSVFHWFNAEAWGLSGSKAYVEDLIKGSGLFTSSALAAALEAKQVGTRGAKLFLHQEGNGKNAKVEQAVLGAASILGVGVSSVPPAVGIPPSSSMSFLQKLPQLPLAVIADHGLSYANRFYQSAYDDYQNLDPGLVCQAASLLATSVAELQQYEKKVAVTANCSFVEELLRCLSEDWHCPLFVEYLPIMRGASEFPTSYVGVWSGIQTLTPSAKIFHDIASEISCVGGPGASCGSSKDCGDINRLYCVRGKCVDSSRVSYWAAVSPGFQSVDGSMRFLKDPSLPAFTESRWVFVGLKTFPMVAPLTDVLTLVSGILVTAVSLFAGFLLKRKFAA